MTRAFTFSYPLSIVIPAYNEEGNLENLIEETIRDARQVVEDFEIIIINDGSRDRTRVVADSLAKRYKEIVVVHHGKNLGLAAAWWDGIKVSTKDTILYIEGDGQQPFRDQYDLLEKIQHADLVLGVRSERFDYTFFRKTLSYGYIFLIWLLFGLKYKDVGWSQAYKKRIFEKIQIKSVTPFFDTEVVIKALRNGFTVVEAQSYYRSRKTGSTSLGNIKTAYSMLTEMIKMRLGLLG